MLICAWEDQSKNQQYMCHKLRLLYGKYRTVIQKYSIVILIVDILITVWVNTAP